MRTSRSAVLRTLIAAAVIGLLAAPGAAIRTPPLAQAQVVTSTPTKSPWDNYYAGCESLQTDRGS